MNLTGDLKKQVENVETKDEGNTKLADEKKINTEQLEQVVGGGTKYSDYKVDDIISKDGAMMSKTDGFDKEPNMRDPYFPGIGSW